jgi:AAA domain/Bifunctional DNA primase/polymerase, N-terminal/Primase C terminal 1 (PriCT-1)
MAGFEVTIEDLDCVEAKDRLKALLPGYDLTTVPRSRTGKGWQLFFKHPGIKIPNRAGIIPGLDVRGDGGYVVAPPSIHPSGKQYRWEVPLRDELPEIPPELLRLISSPSHTAQGYRERFNTAQALAGVPEGQRDETLFKFACKLRHADVPQEIAEDLLLEAARNCKPPFSERAALEKIRNAYRRYDPGAAKAGINGHHFSLINAKELLAQEEEQTEWLWDGILPAGGMSLLVAKPKVGKTTLAFNLAVAVSRGADFLGRKTQKVPVIYLALEEKRSQIQKKLKALGVSEEQIYFHFGSAPVNAVKEIEPLITETGAKLLVVDVLQKFCRVKDLNDYSQVTNALEPLIATAREENCHIVLTHHAGKADRKDGDDILGSTGLLGGVDTSIIIKKQDKRRTFFTIQRYGEDTPETVIELKLDGSLEAVGSRQEVEIEETIPEILEALEDGALTEKEIWGRIERNHDVTAKALRVLVERERVNRSGNGKRGDPYRYEKILSFSPQGTMGRAGRESENRQKALQLKEEFYPRNCDLNSLKDGSSGREFLIQAVLDEFPGAKVIRGGDEGV